MHMLLFSYDYRTTEHGALGCQNSIRTCWRVDGAAHENEFKLLMDTQDLLCREKWVSYSPKHCLWSTQIHRERFVPFDNGSILGIDSNGKTATSRRYNWKGNGLLVLILYCTTSKFKFDNIKEKPVPNKLLGNINDALSINVTSNLIDDKACMLCSVACALCNEMGWKTQPTCVLQRIHIVFDYERF
jgi:hypothetical protein